MKLIKIFSVSLAILVLAGLPLAPKIAADSQTDLSSQTINGVAGSPQASQAMQDWQYITPKGCSLTLLVRRSLQLYDQENNDISLSQPGIIYAETNIVQQSDPHLLEIGEAVTVSRQLVTDYASRSTSLTPQQIAAWQVYANNADFNLQAINPVNTVQPITPTNQSPTQTSQPSTKDVPAKPTTPSNDQAHPSQNENQLSDNQSNLQNKPQIQTSSNSGLTWITVISVLAILIYLFLSSPKT